MISSISPVYKSASWGYEGADYLNCAAHLCTRLSPEEVIKTCLKIEQELGRKRTDSKTYTDRNIDIDVLFYEDRIIKTESLEVPHPRLHLRNFVLFPLCDIAQNLEHPVLNKNILELAEASPDESQLEKIDQKLKNPEADFPLNRFNYITIEGNIGAGKTTLSTMIAQDFNAKLILERFKDNPFLPKFYEDQARYAFPLEMSFLADRYQQLLDDIGQYDLFKDFMIADYDSYKSLIFARVTLAEEEYALYKKLHQIMYKELVKPDLYIYLYQNTERLLANIKKRGREYEQNISEDYLLKINQGYLNWIKNKAQDNVKIIDISDLDFVKNREDYLKILGEFI